MHVSWHPNTKLLSCLNCMQIGHVFNSESKHEGRQGHIGGFLQIPCTYLSKSKQLKKSSRARPSCSWNSVRRHGQQRPSRAPDRRQRLYWKKKEITVTVSPPDWDFNEFSPRKQHPSRECHFFSSLYSQETGSKGWLWLWSVLTVFALDSFEELHQMYVQLVTKDVSV